MVVVVGGGGGGGDFSTDLAPKKADFDPKRTCQNLKQIKVWKIHAYGS